jgi:hypothetical protein
MHLPQSFLTCVLCVGISAANAQSINDARADIRATYDFEPSTMTFDEQAHRAPALSALWNRYPNRPEVYAAALRAELQDGANRELLYCDGGMLLLAQSREQHDQALGLTSIQKCSLAEIQHTPYFYTMHSLAVRGIDTFDLQVRILSKPKYSVFIVQHALSLGQDYAFLYPLLVQDESTYVPRLLARLADERDDVARRSLVRALWYAATPEAESAIRAIATDPAPGSPAKDDARKLLEKLKFVRQLKPSDSSLARIRAAVGATQKTTQGELRAKRRARMRSISDEALHDLEAYTALIYYARSGN